MQAIATLEQRNKCIIASAKKDDWKPETLAPAIKRTIEVFGWDRVMFSTDYPHWDQDDPRYAFKVNIPEANKKKLFRENALAFYGLD